MAKTVRKDEMRIILHLMAQYYEHCVRNHSTLLVRFYGIYRVSPLLGRRVSVKEGGVGGWWCGGV